jgi:hypothetical protein
MKIIPPTPDTEYHVKGSAKPDHTLKVEAKEWRKLLEDKAARIGSTSSVVDHKSSHKKLPVKVSDEATLTPERQNQVSEEIAKGFASHIIRLFNQRMRNKSPLS